MSIYRNAMFVAMLAIVQFSCGKSEAKQEANTENTAAADSMVSVRITAEQMKTIGIQVGGAQQKEMPSIVSATGLVSVLNENKALITSVYGGIVKSIQVHEGSLVKAGDIIATIANPELISLQEEYLLVKEQLNAGGPEAVASVSNAQYAGLQEQFNTLQPQIQLAEAEVKRQKELNAGKAGSTKALQQAETELATLTARRTTLQAQMSVFSKNADASLRTRKAALESKLKLMGVVPSALHSDGIRDVIAIRSPIAGKIAHIEAKIGAFIGQNQSIAEVIDLSNLHLDLNVYEADLPKFSLQQSIRFTTTNNPSRTYTATVHTIGAALDPATKTVAIHAHIDGDKTGLVEGMSVQATVQVGNTKVTAVPTSAIAAEGSQHFVFVQTATDSAGTTFRRVPVNKGNTDGQYTEITPHRPLPAGAWIALNQAFFIMGAINNTGEE